MYTIITIVVIILCILLGAIVLIQNPKGGGLSAGMGGVGQQILGARRSTETVEKLTWGFAIGFMALCLLSAVFINKNAASTNGTLPKSETEKNIMNTPTTTTPGAQTLPTQQAPAQPAPAQP